MTKATSLRRTTTLPPLDPIETEILELQLATLTLEIAISEGKLGPPPFVARRHAQFAVADQADVLVRHGAVPGEDVDGGLPRPPPI